MYAADPAMLAALRGSHRMTSRVEVLDGGRPVAELAVTKGAVTCRSSAGRRRTLSCGLGDPTGDLTPAGMEDMLAPNGNELRAWRGVSVPVFSGGALTRVTYEVPVGVFGIFDVDVTSDYSGGTQVDLTAYDRSQRVAEDQFWEPYVVAAGTNYTDAIQALVARTLRSVAFKFTGVSYVAPQLVFDVGSDPWAEAEKMASSVGCELFFDADGACVLRDVPDPDEDPVAWAYEEGDGVVAPNPIFGASKKLSRAHTYNGVLATGESSAILDQAAAPVAAVAWDDNPNSPTYYLGKFGRRLRRYSSPFIITPDQAASAARAILRSSLGVSEDVTFDGVVNAAHEPGDVVSIYVAKSKIDARYVLDEFNVPLTEGESMKCGTRRRAA